MHFDLETMFSYNFYLYFAALFNLLILQLYLIYSFLYLEMRVIN